MRQINEAAPAADTASAGLRRVTRIFGYCALRPLPTFGGQPCVDCGGSGVATNQFAPFQEQCQVVSFSSTDVAANQDVRRAATVRDYKRLSYGNAAANGS